MTTAVAKIDFSTEQMKVIESQFFPAGASTAEQQYCFSVAKELGLNPITREIFFISRRQKVGDKWVNKIEPMVSRDGYVAIAHRSGQLGGMETIATIREVPRLVKGEWLYVQDLMAECKVWRKDSSKPFSVQVAYSEYCQRTSDGTPTKFWVEKPETMLKKVAESQALRKAFNIHGVYCPEELGAGFESSNEIITPAIDVEYTSSLESESRKPVAIENKATRHNKAEKPKKPVVPTTIEHNEDEDEGEWPVGMPPEVNQITPALESVAGEIVALLDAKAIPYNIDYENGIIAANSFHNKDLLKQNGFKWSPDNKSWVYMFETA